MVNSANPNNVNVCDGCADDMFIANVDNCTNYYICRSGVPILQQCENGRYFDGPSQSCVTTNTKCLTCAANDLSFVYLAKTCNKFFICLSGQPILDQCADNLQFNQTTSKCDVPTAVNCVDNQCPIINDASNIKFVPSKKSCKEYFICMNGDPVAQTCTDGLLFNTTINKCDYASNVTCPVGTAKLNSRTTPSRNRPPVIADINCPKRGIHFYPHNDNSRYYLCSNGKGALLSCTDGLFFDRTISACREPKNIKY